MAGDLDREKDEIGLVERVERDLVGPVARAAQSGYRYQGAGLWKNSDAQPACGRAKLVIPCHQRHVPAKRKSLGPR